MWTYEHSISYIPALAVMIAVALLIRPRLIRLNEGKRRIPLFLIAIALVALELGKQAVSLSRGYNLFHIPLHYCSLFIILVPLSAILRGKIARAVTAATAAIGSALFLLMAIAPSLIYSKYSVLKMAEDFIGFHSVVYHMLAVFSLILIFSLELHTPDIKHDFIPITVCVGAYSVVGGVFAQLLKTNFNNFYFCEVAEVDAMRLAMIDCLGYPLGQCIYVILAMLVNVLFTHLAYLFYVGLCKLKTLAFRNR